MLQEAFIDQYYDKTSPPQLADHLNTFLTLFGIVAFATILTSVMSLFVDFAMLNSRITNDRTCPMCIGPAPSVAVSILCR